MKRRAACVAAALLVVASVAYAQSARPGMRLTVTRVAPTGGFTASGFLVVHASSVTRSPASDCGTGALRIEARGTTARGRVRSASIGLVAVAEEHPTDLALRVGRCQARISILLDDGSTVELTQGTVRAHLVGSDGLDATFEGSALDAARVPTTVSGHIVLSSSP